ncbi:MAG: hypothetical protein IPN26_02195 [Bacteroidetes bacterium]|nr:hypothetical protein [Bacteroidota bacterium]
MKKLLFFCISLQLMNHHLKAQSLSPQVIASSGGYQSNAAGSLSFTIGETNTQTLSSANHILTQGFQQPFEINLFHLKAYLQGYYIGAGQMGDVLYNQGVYANPSIHTDSVTIEFRQTNSPYLSVFQKTAVLKQDGTLSLKGMGTIGQAYYIVVKHRNHIETWSANPVMIQPVTNYDFSTADHLAYGSNQKEMEVGVWAFFTGDINQDGVVDGLDYNDWKTTTTTLQGLL